MSGRCQGNVTDLGVCGISPVTQDLEVSHNANSTDQFILHRVSENKRKEGTKKTLKQNECISSLFMFYIEPVTVITNRGVYDSFSIQRDQVAALHFSSNTHK